MKSALNNTGVDSNHILMYKYAHDLRIYLNCLQMMEAQFAWGIKFSPRMSFSSILHYFNVGR